MFAFPAPSHVNGYPVVACLPASLSAREVCSYVACYRADEGDWVTWLYNHQTGGAGSGHYGIEAFSDAVADVMDRAR